MVFLKMQSGWLCTARLDRCQDGRHQNTPAHIAVTVTARETHAGTHQYWL